MRVPTRMKRPASWKSQVLNACRFDRRNRKSSQLPPSPAWRGRAQRFRLYLLSGVDDLDAAVLGPAVFGRIGAGRALFAVADHGDLAARTTVGLHGRRHGVAAALAEALVVLAAAAFIGIAFQRH